MNLNKDLGSVAEAVKKVMEAELSPKQKQIAKMAEPKHKIDAGDLAKLRAGHKPVKEEKDGASKPQEAKFHGKLDKLVHKTFGKSKEEMKKEEVEQIDEMGYSATAARAGKDIGKPGKMFGKIAASAAKRYGSEEKGKAVAGAVLKKLRMKEDVDHEITDEETEEILNAYDESPKTFSEMLKAYKEEGIAFFAEEPTQDEYEKEVEKAKAKSQGKEKADVAAAAVQAVKQEQTHTKVQVIDMTDANEIKVSTIDLEERSLTEPEAKKKEEIVKSMKKKMSGFKERYGERAKNVMYATATKMAKKD